MTKSRLFYLASLVCLLLVLSFAFITLGHVDALIEEHNNTDYTNDEIGLSIGTGLALAISKILIIAGIILYSLPTLIKLIAVISNGRAIGIVSLILDSLLTLRTLTLTVITLINSAGKTDFSVVWIIGTALFTLAALVLCAIAIKYVPQKESSPAENEETVEVSV